MREAPLELLEAVGRRIKALRQARGLTQDAVAEALGIAVKNVQRLEAGGQNLTLKTLAHVADVLDVEPHELLKSGAVSSPDAEVSLKRALRGLTRLGHELFAADAPPARGGVPVMSLQAAASRFGGGRNVEVSAWLRLKGARQSQLVGRFVAQVAGRSMSPTVPSGALVLFRSPVVGPLDGRVVVAEWRDYSDPETGGAYVLKRVGSVESRSRGGLQLQLRSDNPDFPPLLVQAEDASELRVIAELERVLWPAARK
ncbi:MAG: LexA family transcriptional regulator [Myxococcales bacterium]